MERSKPMKFRTETSEDIRYYIKSILLIHNKEINYGEMRFGLYVIDLKDRGSDEISESLLNSHANLIASQIGEKVTIEFFDNGISGTRISVSK